MPVNQGRGRPMNQESGPKMPVNHGRGRKDPESG